MTRLAERTGRPARSIPGQPDMWAFVLFESLLFTSYFAVYLFSRTRDPQLYLESQSRLNLAAGVVNTILLLSSSWAIARCVQAGREQRFGPALRDAALTAALGLAFLVSKVAEWVGLVRGGDGFATNDFFMHYFFLTGIHCLHLLIGFVVLGVIAYQLRSPARRSQVLVETGATYWHTVDFLWVLIFALLYVVR